MNDFEYLRPTNLDETLSCLSNYGGKSKLLAGGTDLVLLLQQGLVQPSHIIDISNVSELNYIREEDGHLKVGAATKMRDIETSELVRGKVPLLAEASQLVGEIGVRNIATIGGNLANASPAADSAPPLLVLDASVKVRKSGSQRTIKLTDFFLHVKKTVLAPDELMTEVDVPIPPTHSGGAFFRLAKRGGNIISIVSAGAFLALKGKTCSVARIAMGSVAPTPIRIKSAEKTLEGAEPTPERIRTAAQNAFDEVKPITDIRASAEYRRDTSRVYVRKAIEAALSRANSWS
jgi:carbon-monoxide dehydrogenase medium subunit